MTKIILGDGLTCDLQSLIDTRLLIQANSGGGKSHTLRRLLEETYGKVQHLVIDPEGEFPTLRERFGYVIAARSGGDTAADPRSAKLLAEKLLAIGASAILDIYELKAHERIRFVRLFLEALVDAPKSLWHPALVVVDEAHVYCPQHGEAESAAAVIDLATRGRKRGFCAVLATQRIAKLHKDAAAELNNKLIGRTGLDVDMKRAGDELGFTTREQLHQLRTLAPGEFFAFGPAFGPGVERRTIAGVRTTHPKAGARLTAPVPPPTKKILALLPQLADLPAEAEEKARTEADLRRELATVRSALTRAEKQQPTRTVEKPVEKIVERLALKDGQLARAEKLVQQVNAWCDRQDAIGQQVLGIGKEIAAAIASTRTPARTLAATPMISRPSQPVVGRPVARGTAPASNGNGSLPKGERLVLTAIVQAVESTDEAADREYVTQITGYKRSTRDTYLQRLGEKSLVEPKGDGFIPTAGGYLALGAYEQLPTGDALLQWWLTRLPGGEAKVLEAVAQRGSDGLTRDAITDVTGYKRSTRDTYVQRLGTRRLVAVEGQSIIPSVMLFDS